MMFKVKYVNFCMKNDWDKYLNMQKDVCNTSASNLHQSLWTYEAFMKEFLRELSECLCFYT